MTFNSAQSKQLANKRKRDEKGHFVKKDGVKLTTKVKSPTTNIIPEFEKPIVSLSVNNPLRKIMYWLNEIRKHQTTTLAFKLSIPLVVVPVIIAAAFSVGRVSGMGVIPYIGAQNPTPKPMPTTQPPITISRAGTLKIAKSATNTNYLLSLKNGEIMILEVPKSIDLAKYGNKQILVSGEYDKATNILKVAEIAQIEVYNSTTVPESTKSAN